MTRRIWRWVWAVVLAASGQLAAGVATASSPPTDEHVWVWTYPRQCRSNAWERGSRHALEIEQLAEHLGRQGIVVHGYRSERLGGLRCASCSCGRGDAVFVLVSAADQDRTGFRPAFSGLPRATSERTRKGLRGAKHGIGRKPRRRRRGAATCGDAVWQRGELCYPERTVAAGVVGHGLERADIDEDGLADAVAATLRGVVVVPGDRRRSAVTLGGDDVRDVAVGDVNNDGHDDVVAIGSATIETYLGNGRGRFPKHESMPFARTKKAAIVLADVTADGRLDIVVTATQRRDRDFPATRLLVLAGRGRGRFRPLPRAVDTFMGPISAVDLDGDRRLDIVVGGGGSPVVHRGLGRGRFAPPRVLVPGVGAVAVADLDGDRFMDLVVAQEVSSTLDLWFGGKRGRTLGASLPLDARMARLRVADADSDGVDDVVALTNSGSIRVFRGEHGRRFAPPQVPALEVGWGIHDVVFADADGDRRHDALVAGGMGVTVARSRGGLRFGRELGSERLEARERDAHGTLEQVSISSLYQPLFTDLDRDGDDDLVTSYGGQSFVKVWRNDDGTFTEVSDTSYDAVHGRREVRAVRDLDGNRTIDLVVLPIRQRTVLVFAGTGLGSFDPAQTIVPDGWPRDVEVADVTGDALLDLVIATQEGRLEIHPGVPGGRFDGPRVEADAGMIADWARVADLDRDGLGDVVLADRGEIVVYRGLGGGRFAAGWRMESPSPAAYAIRDVNRDDVPDLVAAAGTINVHRGDGNGAFESPVRFRMPARSLGTGQGGTVAVVALRSSDPPAPVYTDSMRSYVIRATP